MRFRTPDHPEKMREMTNAESAARTAHRIRKTGSDGAPFKSCHEKANGKIRQNRIAKNPHRLRGEIPVGLAFNMPDMIIAPRAGPNAPITPTSIRYVGFFIAMTIGTAQMIQEQAKATMKNAVIGCFLILSDQLARIIIPVDRYT